MKIITSGVNCIIRPSTFGSSLQAAASNCANSRVKYFSESESDFLNIWVKVRVIFWMFEFAWKWRWHLKNHSLRPGRQMGSLCFYLVGVPEMIFCCIIVFWYSRYDIKVQNFIYCWLFSYIRTISIQLSKLY